jgi:hypothetical protein
MPAAEEASGIGCQFWINRGGDTFTDIVPARGGRPAPGVRTARKGIAGAARDRGFADSPLEQAGFELPVPLAPMSL